MKSITDSVKDITQDVSTILGRINSALRGKSAQPADDYSEVPDRINSIEEYRPVIISGTNSNVEDPAMIINYDTIGPISAMNSEFVDEAMKIDYKSIPPYSAKTSKIKNPPMVFGGKYYESFEDLYTQLDAIQSTGAQYIDTKVKGQSGLRFVGQVYFLAIYDEMCFIGRTGNSTGFYAMYSYQGKWYFRYGTGVQIDSLTPQDKWITFDSKLFKGEQYLKIDGTKIYENTLDTTVNTNANLQTFARDANVFTMAKTKGYQIFALDNMVRDFVPAIRNRDSVVGLYDRCRSRFYTNSGTGELYPIKETNWQLYYQPVDWLQAVGEQYINTGYVLKSGDKVVIDCIVYSTALKKWIALYGSRQGNDYVYCNLFFTRYDNNNIPEYARHGQLKAGTNFIYDKRITLTVQNSLAEWTDGIDTYSITNTGTLNDCTNSMFIFDGNYGGARGLSVGDWKSVARLFSFKVYDENNVPKCDFRPCYYKNKNIPGLYDVVRHAFFANSGSNKFIIQEDYQPIEYLQATGSQYIDTGIVGKNTIQFEIVFTPEGNMSTSGYGAIFGSRTSSLNNEFDLNTYTSGTTGGCFRYGTTAYNGNMVQNQEVKISFDGLSYKVNDIEQYQVTTATFNNGFNIYVGCLNNSNSINDWGKFKLKSLKFWDDGTPLADFVPVRGVISGYAGLYNRVNNQFYWNRNTGVFTAGPDTSASVIHV